MSEKRQIVRIKPEALSFIFLPIIAPAFAWLVLVGALEFGSNSTYKILLAIGLLAGVMAAVHHAEVVAHKVGEPYGTLLLAAAVTLIEVAIIVSIMIAEGDKAATLARDTVFAVVMIILNGLVGLCILVGAIRHREQTFDLDGISATLTALVAIVVLTLIFPNYTETVAGPHYSLVQLSFVAIVSLVIYSTFVLLQAVTHRSYFLQPEDVHTDPPTGRAAFLSAMLLILSLLVVVLISKKLSPSIEKFVRDCGVPQPVVGIIIAAIVLLPEGIAAVKAAQRNQLQTSLNLALGSALASIGLTIPAVAVVSLYSGLTLTLGIDIKSTVMLMLSMFIMTIVLKTGRTTVLHGVVLLVIFAVYLFTTIVP
ncbi:MAG: hypothetical protein FWD70_01250 [Desulfuromonadales bacterium]|nr:hypothetical protein [Desulfuromonadales bacterium]